MRRLLDACIGAGFATAVTLLVFDFAAFKFLPYRLVEQFPEYRKSQLPAGFAGRGSYPQHYFAKVEGRGFDIGRNRKGQHNVEGEVFEVWSNSLGCYDQEHDPDDDYVYLVGDSYTWGYAPYDEKFGKLLEENTGWPVYKCGVTHTGQHHQLAKLLEIEHEVGRSPKAMIGFWYLNDVANDYFYPHTTVIEGWQVDTVAVAPDRKTPIPLDIEALETKVRTRIEQIRNRPPPVPPTLRDQALNYSLTLNLLRFAKQAVLPSPPPPLWTPDTTAQTEPLTVYDVEIERAGRLWYADNPMADANKTALIALQNHAREIGALFAVVLIPPREHTTEPDWHSEVHEFLDAQQIRWIDLARVFDELHENADTVFLKDGHFNRYGNRVVAETVEREFGDDIRQRMEEKGSSATTGR